MKHAVAALLALVALGCSTRSQQDATTAASSATHDPCSATAADVGPCILDREWIVEDVSGGGVIDFSRVTVTFAADGSISGLAGCNRYGGTYELTGRSISVSSLISTRMACAPALMSQETDVLRILETASQLSIGTQNELIIHGPDGDTLRARSG